MKENKKYELENLINENTDSFDVFEPSADLWSKIEGKLDSNTNTYNTPESKKAILPKFKYLSATAIAASLAILITAGMFLLLNSKNSNNTPQNSYAVTQAKFAEEEKILTDRIIMLTSGNPELQSEILADLKELDQQTEQLWAELEKDKENPKLIRQTLDSYKVKIEILEKLIEQLEKADNLKLNHEVSL